MKKSAKIAASILFVAGGFLGGVIPAMADYVGNLNPDGDNYLSLRRYPNSSSRELSRMGPGTVLEILDADGPWRYVRTADGRIGWAYSRWILPGFPGNGGGGNYAAPADDFPDEAGDVPMNSDMGNDDDMTPDMPGMSGANAVPSPPAATPDQYDWLEGHLMQFHDPLKYYP
jgi:hypothetical protein